MIIVPMDEVARRVNEDPDLFDEFLKERRGSNACIHCKSDQWTFAGQAPYALVPIGRNMKSTHETAIGTIVPLWLACDHCGNLEFIDSKVFSKWLANRDQMSVPV